GISLLDSRDGSHSVLYPGQSPAAKHDSEFADCATPPDPAKLETHGLALRAGANGHSTLYAVAHGARESIASGGLVATVLLMPGKTFADSIARRPTGAVFEWSPGKHGFEQLRGSELPADNGIEVSADGKEIFVVSSGF